MAVTRKTRRPPAAAASPPIPELAPGRRDRWRIVALVAAVAVYTVLSGMWGVAITDAIQFVIAMLDEGVVQPVRGQTPESWLFGETEVHHLTVAWRLQRDLGVNPAGAALALRLLDEMASFESAGVASEVAAGAGDVA